MTNMVKVQKGGHKQKENQQDEIKEQEEQDLLLTSLKYHFKY